MATKRLKGKKGSEVAVSSTKRELAAKAKNNAAAKAAAAKAAADRAKANTDKNRRHTIDVTLKEKVAGKTEPIPLRHVYCDIVVTPAKGKEYTLHKKTDVDGRILMEKEILPSKFGPFKIAISDSQSKPPPAAKAKAKAKPKK
jgi:hypothetical protein